LSHGNLNKYMLYQLPTGKVIYLSVEEYLDLTPEDIQYYISLNQGADPLNPFFGSNAEKGRVRSDPEEHDPPSNELDYKPDSDEVTTQEKFDINNIPDDSDPSNF
jgi:hypothetical protein